MKRPLPPVAEGASEGLSARRAGYASRQTWSCGQWTPVEEKPPGEVAVDFRILRAPRSLRYGEKGVDYEKRVAAAQRHGKVPSGKRLRLQFPELRIDPVDGPEGTDVERRPVLA